MQGAFTAIEDKQITVWYAHHQYEKGGWLNELAVRMQRPRTSISRRARRLGVSRLDRKQHGLEEAGQSERTKQPRANAQRNGHCAFLEGHSKNVGALCTHGYANADFVDSSAERVGHDAVDADGSQEKSNAGEDAEEFKSKAPLRKESENHSLHGADAKDGNARIHVLNLCA